MRNAFRFMTNAQPLRISRGGTLGEQNVPIVDPQTAQDIWVYVTTVYMAAAIVIDNVFRGFRAMQLPIPQGKLRIVCEIEPMGDNYVARRWAVVEPGVLVPPPITSLASEADDVPEYRNGHELLAAESR